MTDFDPQFPVTFQVAAIVPTRALSLPRVLKAAGRWGKATGTLRITPGAIELEVNRLARRFVDGVFPLVQREGPVTLVRCRGLPLFLQLSVLVVTDQFAAVAVLRPFALNRLRRALDTGGWKVEECATSFNVGTRVLRERYPALVAGTAESSRRSDR